MNIPAAIFGLFVVVAGVAAMIFVVSMSAGQPVYQDSYGGTLTNESNVSAGLVGNITTTGGSVLPPLVLIVGAILLCVVLFVFYIVARQFVP